MTETRAISMKYLKSLAKLFLPNVFIDVIRLFYPLRNTSIFISFLSDNTLGINFQKRLFIFWQATLITSKIESPHTTDEVFRFISAILTLPQELTGVVVEAGCFKGSSSAKFSLAAATAKRELVIFDSFEGIPENDEAHDFDIFGGKASFEGGDYCGSIEEVSDNIARYGKIESCRFVKGFFEETMPTFKEKICAAYIDVDLASSTRTCLKYLYPLLVKGGVIFSQDGHLPLVIEVLDDDKFWAEEVGVQKPNIEGLGKEKLVKIIKT